MKTLLLLLILSQTSIVLRKGTIIYSQPRLNSSEKVGLLQDIEVKVLINVYNGNYEWLYIELPDGSRGFVPSVPGYIVEQLHSPTTKDTTPEK